MSRREALILLGAGALAAEQALINVPQAGGATAPAGPELARATPVPGGYAPDGTAGRAAALPLRDVELLASPFRDNQARNTAYLTFLDLDRMLRPFRLNYGLPSSALPCGGWERPASQIRGHTTGHLMSALALTYANTGNPDALARGRYLVGELAAMQARARQAGFRPGYLSAFPEVYFDWLEEGRPIWSPYYMIHKYLAGLLDQYQLAGDPLALDVAARLGDWVDWRTARLPYAQMQMVLQNEFGGLPEALANLYTITGRERYLAAAQRFYHAQVLDPLADGVDQLAGLQANVTTPKIIACVRMWEETGSGKYRDIAQNFWDIVTGHHVYVIGGAGNYEHFQQPDVVAGQLSNFTCENCVGYNLLKLTRLLHFHQLTRTDLIDYYERTLFNQMLGEQDPASPHGFNCYYTGLSAGAFKRQPLNYFAGGNPGIYATDYDTFTCDTATGLETQAKFADTIYTRDPDGLYVNLFIPSRVRVAGLVLEQATGFPDDSLIALSVLSGSGHDDATGPRAGLDRRAAGGGAQRRAGLSPGGGRLDRDPPAVAGRGHAGGRAAHAAGLRAHPRPFQRAGRDVRAGRAERRLPGRPRHWDAGPRARLGAADRRPADDLRCRGQRPAGDADPGEPRRPRVLHGVLANRLTSVATPA